MKMKGYKKQLYVWLLWQFAFFSLFAGMSLRFGEHLPSGFAWGYNLAAIVHFIASVVMLQCFSDEALKRSYANLINYHITCVGQCFVWSVIVLTALSEWSFHWGGSICGIFFLIFVRDIMNLITQRVMYRHPAKFDE